MGIWCVGEGDGWIGGSRESERERKRLACCYVYMCAAVAHSLCSPGAFLSLYLHMQLLLHRSLYLSVCIYFLALHSAAQYSTAPAQDQLWILHTSSLDLVLSAPFGTTPWMCSFVVVVAHRAHVYMSLSLCL